MRVSAAVSNIQQYVRSPGFRAGRSKQVLHAIDRLIAREDVFPVLIGLSRRGDNTLPINFIHTCADALSAWERMPRAPDKEIEQNLARLAEAADTLATDLDRHAAEILFYGVPLFVANHLVEMAVVPPTDATNERSRFRSPALNDKSKVIGPVLMQSLLRELALRLRAPDEGWRHALRPTKRRDKNAERTFLVKYLVYFFRSNGGRPHWDWIARCVAAMTDSDGFDADHARKLAPNIHPMFSNPREELLWYNKHVYPEPDDSDER